MGKRTPPRNVRLSRGIFPCLLFLAGIVSAGNRPADFLITLRAQYRSERDVDELFETHRLHPIHALPEHGFTAVRMSPLDDRESLRRRLLDDHRVRTVEPDSRVSVTAWPSDTLFQRQWALHDPRQRADIRALEAWGLHRGSNRIIVAIIDTGIDRLHPDLIENLWINEDEIAGNRLDDDHNGFVDDRFGWDFAYDTPRPWGPDAHGTLMAGVIGAQVDNRTGIAGIMHRVSMMALKGLGDTGSGFTSDLIACVYYAVDNGASVINASWGGGGAVTAMREAIRYAAEKNVMFVAAAGNWGRNNDVRPFYPASYPEDNIVSVGASDRFDKPTDWSHFGPESVDLFAPGHEILSTMLDGRYLSASGTSMAAPHVAACLGLLYAFTPGLSYRHYRELLFSAVRPVPAMQGRCVTGGCLDLHETLRRSMPRQARRRVLSSYMHRIKEQSLQRSGE
jgi:subtilisin family serine protease